MYDTRFPLTSKVPVGQFLRLLAWSLSPLFKEPFKAGSGLLFNAGPVSAFAAEALQPHLCFMMVFSVSGGQVWALSVGEERLPGPQESWQLAWFPEKSVLVGSFYNESQEFLENYFLWYHQLSIILLMALVESGVGTGLSECLQQREYFWEVLSCLHVHRLALPSVCDVWHSGKVRCIVLVWQEEPVACLASNWGTAVAEYQAHKAIFTGSFCSCGREGTSFREEKSGHENLQLTKKRHRHCNLCYDSSGLLLEKGRVSRWGPPYSREQHSFVNSLKPWK